MARIDSILQKYDLKTIEGAVEKRRRAEERKLKRLQTKRRKLESELKKIDQQVRVAMAKTAGANGRRPAALKRRPNARRLNDISLAEALEKVMRNRKKPIHYKDLTEQVTKRGLYRTRSKNLLSTVAVTLKRDKRFKKVDPGMYVLR